MWFDRFRRPAPRRRVFTRTLPQPLTSLATLDGCWVSARVVDDGLPVGLMRRTLTSIADADTGWQFFSGDESDAYLRDWNNLFVHSVNLVANCDPAIVPYLHFPRGSELQRDGDAFVPTPASVHTDRDYLA